MELFSLRFIVGITLIVINYPLGWGGVIAGTLLYRKTRRRWWCLAGTGVYGLSWGMLAAGIYLAGPEGMSFVRSSGWLFSLAAAFAVVAGCVAVWRTRRRKVCSVIRYAVLLSDEERV